MKLNIYLKKNMSFYLFHESRAKDMRNELETLNYEEAENMIILT